MLLKPCAGAFYQLITVMIYADLELQRGGDSHPSKLELTETRTRTNGNGTCGQVSATQLALRLSLSKCIGVDGSSPLVEKST